MFVFLPCHSVATWQFVDLCLYRHATLPIGFPHRISRLVVGYYLEEHEPNLLLKRYLLCSLMGALSENQLTFTPRITCIDDVGNAAAANLFLQPLKLLYGFLDGLQIKVGRQYR